MNDFWQDDNERMDQARRSRVATLLAGIVLALLIVFVWFIVSPTKAWPQMSSSERLIDPRPQGFYGVGHAEHHEHYARLPHTPAGYSCCSSKTNGECRPTQARFVPGPWVYHWGNEARTQPHGRWQAMVDGQWMDVPDGRVMDQAYLQSRGMDRWDEQAHVCASKFSRTLYCLIPPDGGN